MTEMRNCSIEDGRIFAENNGKRVGIAGRTGILLHNSWIDLSQGENHQVGIDFRSDPAIAPADVTPDCQRRIRAIFNDLTESQPRQWQVTDQYVQSLPEIYRDILSMFPTLERHRSSGDCLAFQTIYLALNEKYNLGDIREACEQMVDGGAMVIRSRMFACPTELGEQIITKLTGALPAERVTVPRFSPPQSVT